MYFSVTQHSTFIENGALCVCSRVSSVALGMVLSGQCTRPVRQAVHPFGLDSNIQTITGWVAVECILYFHLTMNCLNFDDPLNPTYHHNQITFLINYY